MTKLFQSLVLCISIQAFGQQAINLCYLDDFIDESSGLVFLNGTIISHNDSGGSAYLYEIDSTNGDITRSVFIENAAANDWEYLAQDDNYIYIGDFGNNNGNRTDLMIFRIAIVDYFNSINDTVLADTIAFSYADQTDFTSSAFNTNFDAEAFIAKGDSLYIFTKNWIDSKTNIYSLSKNTGTHSAVKVDSIDTQGLVGGASIDPSSNQIILCGYATVNPFILTINQYSNSNFSAGQIDRYDIPLNGSSQLEGISSISATQHYLSTEVNFTGSSTLHKLSFTGFNSDDEMNNLGIRLYPNPVKSVINIDSDDSYLIKLFDSKGSMVKEQCGKQLNIEGINPGLYLIKLIDKYNKEILQEKVIVQ